MVDARTFQALSDPTRLRILSLLGSGSMNVTAMVEKLDCTQPAVSRHLKVLREAGLIVDARRGKWIEYSSNPRAVAEAAEYLKTLNGARANAGDAPARAAGERRAPRPPAKAKRPQAAGAESFPAGKEEAPAAPETRESRYVISRDEDFIDDLMV